MKESNKFRIGNAGVFDGQKVIHMVASREFVPQLIENIKLMKAYLKNRLFVYKWYFIFLYYRIIKLRDNKRYSFGDKK